MAGRGCAGKRRRARRRARRPPGPSRRGSRPAHVVGGFVGCRCAARRRAAADASPAPGLCQRRTRNPTPVRERWLRHAARRRGTRADPAIALSRRPHRRRPCCIAGVARHFRSRRSGAQSVRTGTRPWQLERTQPRAARHRIRRDQGGPAADQGRSRPAFAQRPGGHRRPAPADRSAGPCRRYPGHARLGRRPQCRAATARCHARPRQRRAFGR